MLEQSIKIIEQALNGANKAGVFTLQESAVILQAFTIVKSECDKTIRKDEVEEVETEEVK